MSRAGAGRRWALASLLALLALAAVAAFGLRPPAWWVEQPAVGPEVEARAGHFEQACVSELHRIRDGAEPWAVRIRESDVNAWLATRLDAWCRHVEIDPIGQIEVRFSSGRCEIAARIQGVPSVAVVPLAPVIRDDRLEPGLGSLRVGRLPVPFLVDAGVDALIESFESEDGEDLRAVLVPLLRGEGVPAKFGLVDGRTVRLRDIELRDDELLLQFETLAKRPE